MGGKNLHHLNLVVRMRCSLLVGKAPGARSAESEDQT